MLPTELQTLIAKFRDNIENYKHSSYNETQLRREFLDKFIKILGWDVDNEAGLYDFFKEVIHEDRLRIGTSAKAPDYCVQVGGKKLFYIEAKKPSVKIIDDADAAFQVRRYGWTAQMPVCLLTDFEEFSVYNTGIKPQNTDKPSTARFFYCRYDELEKKNPQYPEYENNWSYLEGLFSKNAVMRGSLEKIKNRDKRGTQEVDREFLKEIEDWRAQLTNNLVLRNELTERELNFAVQKIIDRIIFLRICEDRGMEAKNTLQKIAKNNDIYPALLKLFFIADDKYNSGLFHFRKEKDFEDTLDTLTSKLKIDDKPLRNIIRSLYDPAPYIFSVMPADILGSIYERFLGKAIRLTSAHRAKIEEKPEVRKAGGVYYTPQYIVNYIVENTIGKQLSEKTPKTLKGFRILDPACGSGSFLINAYQYLLDWHLREYAKDADFYCKQKMLVKMAADSFKLSIRERKRILTEHIFGVDIDFQAVEVTKLSLLLKALEGLQEQEVQRQLFHERILPNLGNNVKCGNSLIGTDFYAQGTLNFSEDEMLRINCFDWKNEFSSVFGDGGFDAVIGNPPYGAEFNRQEREYLHNNFKIPNYQYDSYLFFIEKNILLLKQNGQLGLIIPNTWLLNLTAEELRKYLFSNIQIEKIVHYLNKVFKDAVVDTEVIIFKNAMGNNNEIEINIYNKDEIIFSQQINQKKMIDLNGQPVNIFERKEHRTIKEKAEIFPKLDSLCKITQGTKPFQVGKGKPPQTKKIVDEKPYVSDSKKDSSFIPLLRGSMMGKYQIFWDNDYWIKFGDWLAEPRYSASYDKEKIIIRQTGDSLIATYDNDKFIVRDNLYTIVNIPNINISLKYILGIINSSFLNWYYQNVINNEKGEALAQVKRGHIATLPIPSPDLSQKSDKDKHDKLVSYVEQMLLLKKKEQTEKLPPAKSIILRQINTLEKQIDCLVYELYGLTEEEIRIVEGG